ncbi:MAG: hypothetical protein LBD99_06045, partial [Candidatus Margulisbacteria bacterium]|nr:hypothetical protein [Candidatus Margulisiibacteriota bacterium]
MLKKFLIISTCLFGAVFADLAYSISPVDGSTDVKVTENIVITITDSLYSTNNISTVTITVNGRSVSNLESYKTADANGYIYTLPPNAYTPQWGKEMKIEIMADKVNTGNNINRTSSYTTINPPIPTAPTIEWVNNADRNTTDNQVIKVRMPNAPLYIDRWVIS